MGAPNNKQTVKKDLLIVDDDAAFLLALEKSFSKYYNVRTAKSGTEALNIIKSGFKPGVIISDQQMPDMTGSKFFAETLKLIPDTIRILITGFYSNEEIMPTLKEGRLYLYVPKPHLDIQLMQIVRNAFNYYETFQKNKYLTKQLNLVLSKFKSMKQSGAVPQAAPAAQGASENSEKFKKAFDTFTSILNLHEKFYFYYRNQAIPAISESIAKELKLDPASTDVLLIAAKLINAMNIAMPEKYRLYSPEELNEGQRKEYFEYFRKSLKILASNKDYERVSEILSQIWERADGSGHPRSLKGEDIEPLAQIIAIANMFHNNVYRISPDDYQKLVEEGMLEQSQVETQERHREATKFLFRNQPWFSKKIFEAFKNVLNGKKCHALVPKRGVLKSRYSIINIEKEEEESIFAEKIEAIVEIEDEKFKEKSILVRDLQPGMIIAKDMVSSTGMLIVKRHQQLTQSLINNMQQLESVKMLKDATTILIPDKSRD